MPKRGLTIVCVAASVLVLARSAVFLLWEHAGFESDQAIFGLMAKHIAEGRAFPIFIYGDRYLLAVQAWLAAPLFAIAGPSVAALKTPVVLVNIATACLLVWVLHRDGGLRPLTALLTSLFFVFAPPALANALVETGGGNPEPFLYVLLLWVLRHRPLALGIVFGFGFVHREFTAYGLTAIIALAVLDDRRPTFDKFKTVALACVGYLLVWQLVRAAFLFSTPSGPGSAITATLGGGDNIAGLTSRYCWAPDAIAPGLAELFGRFFGIPFGADDHGLAEFGIRSMHRTRLPGVPAFWPVLGAVFAGAFARVSWLAVRDRRPLWRTPAAIGSFLVLVGLQAGVAYAVARCGRLNVETFRYALLMTYLGVGIVALFFIYETRTIWRGAMVAAMLAWMTMSAAGHARLLAEYLYERPPHPRRVLATYLVDHGIRYARSDYWTAYATTFLANEKVIVASNDVVRISGYQADVARHEREAVIIQGQACRAGGGTEVVPGMYWVCPQ